MSHLWPHPPYAEDQPNSKVILTTHVLFRGFQTGAFLGPLIGTARHLILRRRSPHLPPPFVHTILRSTGTSAVVGTGFLAVALVVRMWGREDIEWKDRSWRLLENRGQKEVDAGGILGMGVGGALSSAARGFRWAGWRTEVGSLGLGGTCGVIGYMIWRHGIKKGKWEDAS